MNLRIWSGPEGGLCQPHTLKKLFVFFFLEALEGVTANALSPSPLSLSGEEGEGSWYRFLVPFSFRREDLLTGVEDWAMFPAKNSR